MNREIVLAIPVLLFAVITHECAHGWMAEKCGDSTARYAGRITLNPLPHIDLMGSIILPFLLIIMRSSFLVAWAKPVPVNFYNLRNPKKDMIWVSLAGPVANIILAAVCGILLKIGLGKIGIINVMLGYGIHIGLLLASFNLVPVPPLDGSKILMGILPVKYSYQYSKLEPYGSLILFAALFLGVLWWFVIPIYNFFYFLLKMLFIL